MFDLKVKMLWGGKTFAVTINGVEMAPLTADQVIQHVSLFVGKLPDIELVDGTHLVPDEHPFGGSWQE